MGLSNKFYERSPFIEIIVIGLLLIFSYALYCFIKTSQNTINFVGIFGSIATIVGFYLTLYQLRKLRTIASVSFDAKVAVNKQRFLYEAENSIEKILDILNETGKLFLKATQFDSEFIGERLVTLRFVLDEIRKYNDEHIKANYFDEFDCNDCITCLDEINKELLEDLKTKEQKDLSKKFKYYTDINTIKDKFITIKSNLKNEREFK